MATNKGMYPSTSYGVGGVYFEFGLMANGAASPLLSSVTTQMQPYVQSIVRTGVGVNVVTLNMTFFERIYASADVDDSTASGAYGTIGNFTNLGTANNLTFTLRTYTAGGTLTDLAAGTYISTCFRFRNSTGK